MTFVLELGDNLLSMPEPFRNLYKSIGRVTEYKFNAVNRVLRTEPYCAELCHKDDNSTLFRAEWYMRFDSYDDYVAFCLKWS